MASLPLPPSDLWVLAILAATVGAILLRPLRLNEAWFATAGGLAMLAAGAVGPADLAAVAREALPVLLFLAGMLVAGAVARQAGVFALAALWVARAAGHDTRRLFCGLYLLGAAVTVLLSLDTTAVVLTPIVFHLVRQAGLPPVPFAFLCTHVANTASLLLPVSNLTNLLVQARLGIPFWRFVGVMVVPALLVGAAHLGALYLSFRRDLQGGGPVRLPEMDAHGALRSPFLRWSLVILSLTLAAFPLAGLFELPLWPFALGGGGALAALALARREVPPSFFARQVSWAIVPFVVGLSVVIRGAENAGLGHRLVALAAGRQGAEPGGAAPPSLAAFTFGTALGANLINNIPMTLIGLGTLPPADPYAPYALLLGVNLGPLLTVVGSLATMLALNLIREAGFTISGTEYLKRGLLLMPLTLAAGCLGLEAALRLGLR